MDILVILFYGPYWLFCLARAIMIGPTLVGTGKEPPYGVFNTVDGLAMGFFGSIVWLILAGLILAALCGITTELMASSVDDEEENE